MLKHYQKDDYSKEPVRSENYSINSKDPFNAEPYPPKLVQDYFTPNDIFYIRNHAPVPLIEDINDYKLLVNGYVKKPCFLSYEQLTNGLKFPITFSIVTLMCAGNRRNEMSVIKKVKGVGWNQAALSTAEWTGVRLRDILDYVGADLDDHNLHVEFEGLDFHLDRVKYQKNIPDNDEKAPGFKTVNIVDDDKDTTTYPVYSSPFIGYGSSIPMKKAASIDDCVLLAWKMNGQTLSPDHGYPLRSIVPCFIGARSVKWLWRITVLNHESDNFYQQRDYKVFPPSVDWDTVDNFWDTYPAIQRLDIQAAICSIEEVNTPLPALDVERDRLVHKFHCVDIKGYALSDAGSISVELSLDGGVHWFVPKMFYAPLIGSSNSLTNSTHVVEEETENSVCQTKNGSWVLWQYRAIIPSPTQIVCQATSSGICIRDCPTKLTRGEVTNVKMMPEDVRSIWNLRGVMNNAWHRVTFTK